MQAPATASSDPRSVYDERLQRFAIDERTLARDDRRLSWLRLGAFVASLASLAVAFWVAREQPTPWYVAAALFLLVFLLLVWRHTKLSTEQRRVRAHVRLNTEALHRLARTWDALPVIDLPERFTDRPIARDLMLFGRASLYQVLGAPGTRHGRETLASWLSAPATPAEIAERQPAVDELAPRLDMRQALAWRTEAAGKLDPEPFLEWAEGERWLAKRRWLLWLARVLPVALIASAVAQTAGWIDQPLWGVIVFVNIILSLSFGERVHGIFERISSRKGKLSAFEEPFAIVTGEEYGTPRMRALRERMRVESEPADRRMRTLSTLVELAGLHHSQMTYMPIQALTLWDFHVLDALERWQAVSGRAVRGWLAALGEIEALSSLAQLRHDEPSWCFPEVVERAPAALEATSLGHPLIASSRRVTNDVTVGPEGTFLLVTGSNMSGKSTLLRAIGLNAVLAQAGGPVCAARMTMPPLELGTSIVIEDSLADGVSFFMAELRRLREIVTLADECRATGRRLLYLLDEILRGTNAIERQIAARQVIMHLVDSGAIGAVSTHDTGLAAIEELMRSSIPVHFQETIDSAGDGAMTFDYRLRDGLATTTNALKLLELVGLSEKRPLT
jgi:energy-coupling factor transporter ATP-binding protein EcfA2